MAAGMMWAQRDLLALSASCHRSAAEISTLLAGGVSFGPIASLYLSDFDPADYHAGFLARCDTPGRACAMLEPCSGLGLYGTLVTMTDGDITQLRAAGEAATDVAGQIAAMSLINSTSAKVDLFNAAINLLVLPRLLHELAGLGVCQDPQVLFERKVSISGSRIRASSAKLVSELLLPSMQVAAP